MIGIDDILGKRAVRRGERYDLSYDPEKVVQGRKLLNPDASTLAVVFPPWHNGGSVFGRLTRRLAKDSAVLAYWLHPQVIEPDAERVLASFKQAQAEAFEAVGALARNYDEVELVGLSLGAVMLSLTARAYPGFTSATIVVGSGRLAPSFWDGQRTRGIRDQMAAGGMTRERLIADWEPLTTNPADFEGTPTQLIVSSTDKVVPTSHQQELATSLDQAGAIVNIQHTDAGHYAAATRFCLAGSLVQH
jgi:predicted esterase